MENKKEDATSEGRYKKFGAADKLGYLLGDLGNDFTFILSSSFLLKFYTDAVGLDAYVIGLIMMCARFFDAFTDVTMGRICDLRPATREGKFRPWIKWMCIPCAAASFLIYQSGVSAFPTWAKTLWLALTYILWGSVLYTSVNIPYGSMASAISADSADRQSLSTYRTVGSTLAGAAIGVAVPLLAYDKTDGGEVLNGGRFTVIAGVLSVLAVAAHLACYALVHERVKIDTPRSKERGTWQVIVSSLKNRALISVIVASVVMLLSQVTMQQMSNYLFPDYYSSAAAQSVFTVAMLVGMLMSAVVAKPLAVRFGKAEISCVSSLLAGAVSLLLFFIRPQSVAVYIGLSLVMWIGLGIFAMVSWALITDVIDYSEKKNGVREDATVYSLYSFARKLGQGAAAGLTGGLLTAIGYGKTEGGVVSDSVRDGIFNISTLIPAVGFILLAAILHFWFPIKKSDSEDKSG